MAVLLLVIGDNLKLMNLNSTGITQHYPTANNSFHSLNAAG